MTENKVLTVIIILLFPVLPALSQDILNYESGSYNEDILVKIENIAAAGDVYYSFDPSVEKPDLTYQGGLLLSALKGEERQYNLKIASDDRLYNYSFIIDRKPPQLPETLYTTSEDGSKGYIFSAADDDDSVFYGYDDFRRGTVFAWDGELLSVPKSGFIYYFAEDEAGNRSPDGMIYLNKQAELSSRTRLDIKSPVEGDYANPQLLYIEKSGYEWIRYSLNGLDPVQNGADYKEPVEIRRYGNVNLKIAAKKIGDPEIVRQEIDYRVNTRVPLKNIPSSGVYSTGLNIKSNFVDYRYCLEERSPVWNDRLFSKKLSINPIYGGVKYISFRIKDFGSEPEAEFRYFYVIDDRYPASPVINIDSELPANQDVTVQIAGPEYSEIYYTVDGSTPSAASKVYDKPFSLNFPEDRNAGSYIIKARAVSLNNKSSEVVTKLVTYDTKAPLSPEVSIDKSPDDGIYRLKSILPEGEKLYYCVDEDMSCITEIDSESFSLDIPEGMEKEFSFVFLAEDASGNRSEFSDELKITIDKKPPAAAEVIFSDDEIVIESEEEVEYSYKIINNGVLLEKGGGLYTEPLQFFREYTTGTVLKLNVRTTDSAGNSNLSLYTFSQKEAAAAGEAFLFNSSRINIYSGDKAVFHAHPGGLGEKLYYYLTEITSAGEKLTEGPVPTDGDITVSGRPDENVQYLLEVYSVNEDDGKQSKVSSRNFRIDNEKPALPGISGITSGIVSPVKVRISPEKNDDSRLFLVYADAEDRLPEVFSKSAIIFSGDLVFDVENGSRKNFYLKVGAEDAAGNRIVNDEIYYFTIDKETPHQLFNITENAGTATIKPDMKGSLKYYYEQCSKGGNLKEPDEDSPLFTDELIISGAEGRTETRLVKIAAYDEVGNRTDYSEVFSFNFDKKTPEAPAEPETVMFKTSRRLFVSWDDKPDDGEIFYSITTELDEESGETPDFLEYTAPLGIKYPNDINFINIDYFSKDEAGNRSETRNYQVLIPNIQNTDLVEGIKNNFFYNNDLHLSKINGKKIVRYEILTDEIIPPEVTVFSPVLPEILEFKTEEGESIDFIVSLKEFQDKDDRSGGAEQVLRFTIDKQPPQPPEIDGIENLEYYLSDQKAYFKGSEGTIYYNVTASGDLGADEYRKYIDSFEIKSSDGTYRSFLISAYSEDYAGNRSEKAEWTITIDKEIIYVSPDGQDYSEGTRSRPYRTLNKAVEQVKNSKRKTIFVSSGNYFINSPVVIDEEITIYGGFNRSNWFEKEGETIINVGEKFSEGNPVFYVYGGDLNFNNVRIFADRSNWDSLFFINKGNLNINNSLVEADCSENKNLIKQNYGNLYINSSEISGKTSDFPFISTDYGLVTINNSVIRADAGRMTLTLVKAENSINFTAAGSSFIPGIGENITSLKIINSNADLKNNEISCGTGKVSANAIEIVNSKLRMNYCKIYGNPENRITGGITSEDSQLQLKSNNFSITGNNGIIGFKITGGESLIYNNTIKAAGCSDFSYMFFINGGSHSVETNIINMESAAETVFLRSRGADTDFMQNTLLISGGRTRLVGFSPEQNSVLRVINNIIINRPSELNVYNSLVLTQADAMISLKNNCFSGWSRLTDGSLKAEDLISLDLLDGIYSAGQYSDNIEEIFEESFTADEGYHLGAKSACIDSGYDLSAILDEGRDFDGEKRPNPLLNRDPAFDIGADEYYE